MTVFTIYTVINASIRDGQWTYDLGSPRKKLKCFAEFERLPVYIRKKTLLNTIRTMDSGEYETRGRGGKFTLCEKESGRPVWCIIVKTDAAGTDQ